MADLPMVLVAGLARCGSSLTMQMLSRGGLSCVGEHPDFEVADVNHRAISPSFMKRNAGRAAKWLNPHLTPLPAGFRPSVIWLDRDLDEQTESQVKFAKAFFSVPVSRAHRKAWKAGLLRDRALAQEAFYGCPRFAIRFETLITDTRVSAEAIATWLVDQGFFHLDAAAMASVVLPRDARCQPGIDIEIMLAEARSR